jgi:hypothetical protein
VIYVGSFSKTLFPALRLGFLIVPSDLRERLVAARAAADQHPPTIDQAVLADFIIEGHFARHLRRMRVVYRERLEALMAAAARYCGGVVRIRPVQTGLSSTGSTGPAYQRRRRRAESRRRCCRPTTRGASAASTASSSASAPCAQMHRGGVWNGWRWPSRRRGGADLAPAGPRPGPRQVLTWRGGPPVGARCGARARRATLGLR